MINKSIKRNKNFKNIQGITLVEIMVAIMLSTIVFGSIYMVWSKVRYGIARSNTKQLLLHDMRKVSNYMQNDFKSIKFDEESFKLSEGGNGNFSLAFEKFKEEEDGKLAQDSLESVTYELKGTTLTRKGNGFQILSTHCDGVSIKRATAEGIGAGDLESSDEDFKAGREAKLDIEITGKMRIPGSNDEMFHVEKTSVVMRNEYYKKVNKTYVSNFELAKKDVKEVLGEIKESSFFNTGALDAESLKTMTTDGLKELNDTQNDLYEKTKEQIENLNKEISDTETGESWWTRTWDTINIFTTSEGDKFADWRSALEKANTEADVIKVKNELETFVKDKEEDFMSRSSSGGVNYLQLSPEEKTLYKRAYDMAVQDRNIKKANQQLADQAKEDGKPAPKPATTLIEEYKKNVASGGGKLLDKDGKEIDISNNNIDDTSKEVFKQQQQDNAKEAQKIIDYYEKNINLSWMDADDADEDEIGIYTASKTLIDSAESKIELIKTRDIYTKNIELIQNELSRR